MHFIFDLDGTICFDGENIPTEIVSVLKKASKYGHEVIFASARSYRDCLPVLKDDFKKNTVLALNGAAIFKDEQLVDYHIIDDKVYTKIIEICKKFELPYFVDDYFNYSFNKEEKISFFKYVDSQKVAKNLPLEMLKEPIKMVIFVEENKKVQDEIISIANSSESVALMYHEKEKAIYINPRGVNKATSVKRNVATEYIAFGNDKNDIEMFKKAKYAVQIGDYAALTPVANEQIISQNNAEKIATKILELFREYETF